VSIIGSLFSRGADVKAEVSGNIESVFMLTGYLYDNTDETANFNIYSLPLGPITIPKYLTIGPSITVNAKASVRSTDNVVLMTGARITVPPFDTQLFHVGGVDSTAGGRQSFRPKIEALPTHLNLLSEEDQFGPNTYVGANFTVVPKIHLALNVFGQTIAEGVRFISLLYSLI
jgi:hypothetical protein